MADKFIRGNYYNNWKIKISSVLYIIFEKITRDLSRVEEATASNGVYIARLKAIK